MSTTEAGRRERTTLSMLAAEAGVSLSTISKVLNGHADVAPSTRQRVELLLDEHEYRRRGTAAKGSTLVELVFSDLSNPWGTEVMAGVQEVAHQEGMSVVLSPSSARHEPSPEWLPGMLRRRPAGVLLVSTEPTAQLTERLASRSIPFAVIDPAGELAPGIAAVGSTNWAGGLAATRHLIELGHTRIAAVSGHAHQLCSWARLDGFRSGMGSAGLPVREDWVLMGDFLPSGGRRAAELLLAGDDRPTAIFAGNDMQALGIIEVATERGLRVPEDLSVVGYDDTQVATWARPRLTTVHQPIRRMAAEATRIVLALAAGEAVERQRLELATHLVVRDSTARPTA
ncbi:LacI family DNA-binding transcriptional regulator [Amnibacterium kyonggiense]|uniref:LacI family transcriptional regulator n=1 Tax=Amnibacterium kyonggiense TaxID=595671 RepID=A0A4R7FS36_9MICO|nr:LacI family DNA-binding transcriptional regulator [Amnibacterium kyonggiense]TDS80665.1 LacI family transcriptional regulator [Amnibacterium kyonggiense]